MEVFLFLFLGISLLMLALVVYTSWINGISPTSSSKKAIEEILALVSENDEGTIYELGSGWGRLAFPLASKCSQARVVAYENSLVPYLFSKIYMTLFGKNPLEIIRANFYHRSLSDANIVICYLFPGAMKRLKEKFEKELTPGTQVISNTFAIPGWKPKCVIDVRDFWRSKLYVYQFGNH